MFGLLKTWLMWPYKNARGKVEARKKKKEPFRPDEIRIIKDLGNGEVLTRAYYKGEPIGREVILKTTSSRAAYFNQEPRQ